MINKKVIYDLFPARVLVIADAGVVTDPSSLRVTDNAIYKNSRRVEAVRIVLTSERVLVAADSSTGPVIIFSEAYDPASANITKSRNSGTSTVITASNKYVIFEKDQNCGCGSRLKSWNPYRTMMSSKDPTE